MLADDSPRLTDEEASRKYSDDLVRFDSVSAHGGSRGTYIYDDFVSLYDCSTANGQITPGRSGPTNQTIYRSGARCAQVRVVALCPWRL